MEIIKFFKEDIAFDDLKYGAIFLYDGDIYLKVQDNEINEEENRAAVVLDSEDFEQFDVKFFGRNIIIDKLLSAELTLYD